MAGEHIEHLPFTFADFNLLVFGTGVNEIDSHSLVAYKKSSPPAGNAPGQKRKEEGMPSQTAMEMLVPRRMLADKDWLALVAARQACFVNMMRDDFPVRTFGDLRCCLNVGSRDMHALRIDNPINRELFGDGARFSLETRGLFFADGRSHPYDQIGGRCLVSRSVWGLLQTGEWVAGSVISEHDIDERSQKFGYEHASSFGFGFAQTTDLPVFRRKDLTVRDAARHVLETLRREANVVAARADDRAVRAHSFTRALEEEDRLISFANR